ncbi:MAG: hypothetical protein ABSG15_07815 [FCB group bacterium]|jgi:hypothetical protein
METTIKNKVKLTVIKKAKVKDDAKLWDDLLSTPESQILLDAMVQNVEKEEKDGKLLDGGWDKI